MLQGFRLNVDILYIFYTSTCFSWFFIVTVVTCSDGNKVLNAGSDQQSSFVESILILARFFTGKDLARTRECFSIYLSFCVKLTFNQINSFFTKLIQITKLTKIIKLFKWNFDFNSTLLYDMKSNNWTCQI